MRNYQQITGEDRKMLHFIVALSTLCNSEDCLFPFVIIDKKRKRRIEFLFLLALSFYPNDNHLSSCNVNI